MIFKYSDITQRKMCNKDRCHLRPGHPPIRRDRHSPSHHPEGGDIVLAEGVGHDLKRVIKAGLRGVKPVRYEGLVVGHDVTPTIERVTMEESSVLVCTADLVCHFLVSVPAHFAGDLYIPIVKDWTPKVPESRRRDERWRSNLRGCVAGEIFVAVGAGLRRL